MYTKRHPWDAAMTLDAVLQHINLPAIDITDLLPNMDPKIAEIIMKGLEANPANRWQTVDEMVAALRGEEVRIVRETRELLIKQKQAAAHRKSNGSTAQTKNAAGSENKSLKHKSRPSKDKKSRRTKVEDTDTEETPADAEIDPVQLPDDKSGHKEDGATVSDTLVNTDSEQVVQKTKSPETADKAETDSDETT